MDAVLQDIKDQIKNYVMVLAHVINVDVEVVDKNLKIIAASHSSNELIGSCMKGNSYREILKTKKELIISNPGYHRICENCINTEDCDEVYEIGMPILVNDQIIGIIGLVCYDNDQRKVIVDNFSIYFKFLKQISGMIASQVFMVIEKSHHVQMNNILNSITQKIDEGVIILNNSNEVISMNKIAERMIDKKIEQLEKQKIEIDEVESTVEGKNEYEMNLNGKKYKFLGKYYSIRFGIDKKKKVFIFVDIFTYKNKYLLKRNPKGNFALDKIVSNDTSIIRLKKRVKRINSNSTVLITGESGTGKELFARAIHQTGERKDKPFIAINCAAIPENLLESELFGYSKGAFTGADRNGKKGKIEIADGGVLFLDEIGDMPLYLQAKILRMLEERKVTRIGSNESKKVDIQVISATNQNLNQLVKDKNFRRDLFYRLNVIPIKIPSLKDRKSDIRLLAMHFIKKYSKLFGKKIYKIENNVWKHFLNYHWPGNVRELQNVAEYLTSIHLDEGVIKEENLPTKILRQSSVEEKTFNLNKIEKKVIKKAMKIFKKEGKSHEEIAEELGIGVATLYRKIKRYNL